MRNAVVIDPKWLLDVSTNFFNKGDPNKESKSKQG